MSIFPRVWLWNKLVRVNKWTVCFGDFNGGRVRMGVVSSAYLCAFTF